MTLTSILARWVMEYQPQGEQWLEPKMPYAAITSLVDRARSASEIQWTMANAVGKACAARNLKGRAHPEARRD